MIALLLLSTVAIVGLSWRCVVLQELNDQMQSQIRLQTSHVEKGPDWHKIATSIIEMVRHDWIVIDTQERKLEEILRLACTSGGGALSYCSGITASLTETLRKMRSDLESMRQSKDEGMLELEKLENISPARN